MQEKKILDLSITLWKKNSGKQPEQDYESGMDTLYLCFVPDDGSNPTIVTHFIDAHVAVLYRSDNREIVGMAIEGVDDFSEHFNLEKPWRLSDTGVTLNGMRDMVICIQAKEQRVFGHPRNELSIKKKISARPEYVFA
jgi:hypothetical protein